MASNQPAPDSKVERRKKEILEAASRAFRRQGLHATGMRDIADESRMHVGNLYYYFRNKAELLAFCQEQTLAGLIDLAEQVQQRRWPADQKLHRLITGHVVRLNEEMPGSLAHLEVEALEGPWKEQILEQRDQYEGILCQIIEQGVESGRFRSVDPGVAAKAILGSTNGTFIDRIKLEPKIASKLRDGSEIAFGPHRFIFYGPTAFWSLVERKAALR